ncbi:unnamed protein product [Caenorhabditis auriculariae]|uniref:Uncharacterized protein n=1 Tax=Caenorhabditis auriculariae TaxID=2777116 RepID=A0A8S1HQQ5_9PELO|nr:unnamed protein product [Caenorhabditis auriculariae]
MSSRKSEHRRRKFDKQFELPSGVEQLEPNALPVWVSLWLMATTLIGFLDVQYTLHLPKTADSSNFIAQTVFAPWRLYSAVDLPHKDPQDLLTQVMSRMCLFEIFLNILALCLATRNSRHAALTTFLASSLLLWRKMIFLSEYLMPLPGNSALNPHKTVFEIFLTFYFPHFFACTMALFVISALWDQLAIPLRIQNKYWENYDRASGHLVFKRN